MSKCEDCDSFICDCQDNPKWDKIRAGKSKRYPSLNGWVVLYDRGEPDT